MAGVKHANDISLVGQKMAAVLDEAESYKLESPSRFTGLCRSQSDRIIAADNPIWITPPPGPDPIPPYTLTSNNLLV